MLPDPASLREGDVVTATYQIVGRHVHTGPLVSHRGALVLSQGSHTARYVVRYEDGTYSGFLVGLKVETADDSAFFEEV